MFWKTWPLFIFLSIACIAAEKNNPSDPLLSFYVPRLRELIVGLTKPETMSESSLQIVELAHATRVSLEQNIRNAQLANYTSAFRYLLRNEPNETIRAVTIRAFLEFMKFAGVSNDRRVHLYSAERSYWPWPSGVVLQVLQTDGSSHVRLAAVEAIRAVTTNMDDHVLESLYKTQYVDKSPEVRDAAKHAMEKIFPMSFDMYEFRWLSPIKKFAWKCEDLLEDLLRGA